MTTVSGWNSLAVVTKKSILVPAGVLEVKVSNLGQSIAGLFTFQEVRYKVQWKLCWLFSGKNGNIEKTVIVIIKSTGCQKQRSEYYEKKIYQFELAFSYFNSYFTETYLRKTIAA